MITESIGYDLKDTPTQEQIEAAAKIASAFNFIMQLPRREPDPSRHQKASNCRASADSSNSLPLRMRSLRTRQFNPHATSALDSESEKIV